jgi:hypothetical protein
LRVQNNQALLIFLQPINKSKTQIMKIKIKQNILQPKIFFLFVEPLTFHYLCPLEDHFETLPSKKRLGRPLQGYALIDYSCFLSC